MERFALPITLLVVAAGVLIMAQFATIALPRDAEPAPLSVALAPASVQGEAAEPELPQIEQLGARSGLVDYYELDRRLQALMDDPQMIGLAVAVVENGETVFARGYGETLNGTGEPVHIDTVFRWASLSKGVASTMVGLLAEDGAVDLDAPISRYAPSLRLQNGGHMIVTVADLLSHRLGLEHNGHDMYLERGEDPRILRGRLTAYPTVCAPATCHRYQNVAYDAASEVVEGVTGTSYAEAARQRLFEPLGMTSASMTREALFASPSWARSHKRDGTEEPVVQPYYNIPAAGGMNGSIRDLARWLEVQLGAAPDVVSPAVLSVIQTPVVVSERENRRNRRYAGRMSNARYALGWRVYDYAGNQVVAHRGAVRGYRAMIMMDPARRSGVVVLANSGSRRPFSIPMDVFDAFYQLEDRNWIGADAPEPTAQPAIPGPPPTVAIPGAPPHMESRQRTGTLHSSGQAR